MSTVEIKCAYCGKTKQIRRAEYNRQTRKGRVNWFCSSSHASRFNNTTRKNKPITKTCPYCNQQFDTVTGKLERVFCSASCASKATVNREACRRGGLNAPHDLETNLIRTSVGLRKREAHKYVKLTAVLKDHNIKHVFEAPVGIGVFDLLLPDYKLCIEFDGPEHKIVSTRQRDEEKERAAKMLGYATIRIPCTPGKCIEPESLLKILMEQHII